MTLSKATGETTEIICIIDKSGSMSSVKDDAIGGFNNFLAEQKLLPGKANLTLTLFDTEVTVLFTGKDIQQVEPLNGKTYNPSGMTALLDAVGETLSKVEKRIAGTPESDRAEKTMVVIITDGQENSSHEYSRKAVADKTKELQDRGWQFIYLGANQDAFAEAGKIGLAKDSAVGFTADSQGVARVFEQASFRVSEFRKRTK